MNKVLKGKRSPQTFSEAVVALFSIFSFTEPRPKRFSKTTTGGMAEDWRMVGNDLRKAMEDVEVI